MMKEARLTAEECRNADEGHHEEGQRHRLLAFTRCTKQGHCVLRNGAHADEHGNHGLDNRRSFVFLPSEVSEPLHDYKKVHVAEECQQDDKLWQKLEEEVDLA